jgi:hypothetical protein
MVYLLYSYLSKPKRLSVSMTFILMLNHCSVMRLSKILLIRHLPIPFVVLLLNILTLKQKLITWIIYYWNDVIIIMLSKQNDNLGLIYLRVFADTLIIRHNLFFILHHGKQLQNILSIYTLQSVVTLHPIH